MAEIEKINVCTRNINKTFLWLLVPVPFAEISIVYSLLCNCNHESSLAQEDRLHVPWILYE